MTIEQITAPSETETGSGKGVTTDGDLKTLPQTGAYARAISSLRSIWVSTAGCRERIRDSSPYTFRPASLRDVVEYTRRGGWIPGDHSRWMESPGYGFGALAAIPATAVLAPLLWVVQRPLRTAAAALVYGLMAWAGVGWLVQYPLRWMGYALLFLGGGSW